MQREQTTKTISIDEAQRRFRQLVNEVAEGDVLVMIEQDGQEIVRMESAVSRKQREINRLMTDPEFRELAAIGEALKDIPIDELEREVARGIREGRARKRKERERSSSD